MTRLLLVCLFLLPFGCAKKQFSQEELRSELPGAIQVIGEEVQAELAKRAQLPKPFRLAVHFEQPRFYGADNGIWNRWSASQRQQVLDTLKDVPKEEISAVFPLFTDDAYGEPAGRVRSLRVAAARQRADALLVVSASGEEIANPNGLAVGYLLLAPLFFLHGTDFENLVLTRAALWDVKNEYLYAAVEGEGYTQSSRAALAGGGRERMQEAWKASLNDLCEALKNEVAEIFRRSTALAAL